MQVNKNQESYSKALFLTIAIFFFWGFSAAANILLIPLVKETFQLSQLESQLIEFSFYFAYFSGSFLYLLANYKQWSILASVSTKQILITGLLISALGTFAIVLVLPSGSYILLLICLFSISFGFSLQQIAANPTLIKLGGKEGGAHRLTLAGALGSTGSAIAPLILGYFAFNQLQDGQAASLSSLTPIYIALAIGYLLFAYSYKVIDMPNLNLSKTAYVSVFELLNTSGFKFSMLALFCYVGGEVTLQSNLPALLKDADFLGISTQDTVKFISLFGGGLLIGRTTASVFNFPLRKMLLCLALFVVPGITFVFVLVLNWFSGEEIQQLLGFTPFILALPLGLLLSKKDPRRILLIASLSSVFFLLGAIIFNGYSAMFCILAVSLFSAVMWPCIFALSIEGLEQKTQLATAILIMMIVGGAVVPLLQGSLADITWIGIQLSYIVPLFCFLIVGGYAFRHGAIEQYSNSKLAVTE